MSVVDLAFFKKHCRVDDFADDDNILEMALEAAETWVVRRTNRSVDELIEIGGGEFPKPLVIAICMLAGTFYEQRESVTVAQTYEVGAYKALIDQYTKLGR